MEKYNKFSGFNITIPTKPIPWKRPAGTFRRYDSQKQEKLAIGLYFRKAMGNHPPLTGPVFLNLCFYFQPPKNFKPKCTLDFYNKNKPDVDNLEKFILDTLKDAGVLKDDCIIVKVTKEKKYLDLRLQKEPYTYISIVDWSLTPSI